MEHLFHLYGMVFFVNLFLNYFFVKSKHHFVVTTFYQSDLFAIFGGRNVFLSFSL